MVGTCRVGVLVIRRGLIEREWEGLSEYSLGIWKATDALGNDTTRSNIVKRIMAGTPVEQQRANAPIESIQ